jgi:hypothetical protein
MSFASIANNQCVSCNNLQEVIFPTNQANMNNMTNLFSGLAPSTVIIQRISNIDKLGSTSTQLDFATFCSSIFYTGGTISSLLRGIVWNGNSATTKVALSTLRLSNASSLFAGTSPQINVSYSNMGQAALVDLFNDIPTLTGKTINITGATGAAALTAPERAIATGKGWTITG